MASRGTRAIALVFTVVGAAVLTAVVVGLINDDRQVGATSTVRETPSSLPTPSAESASVDPAVVGTASPTPSDATSAFVGLLSASICDLGVCCPALAVDGVHYLLVLPVDLDWAPTDGGYRITDATGAVLAREGDMLSVEGEEAGGGSCWATNTRHALTVSSLSVAK